MKPWEGKGCSDTGNAINSGHRGDHVCTDQLRSPFMTLSALTCAVLAPGVPGNLWG